MTAPEKTIPTHLGLILDGNRRWARDNGLPQFEGHRRGYDVFVKISERALEHGIKYMSAFVFSTENWQRSSEEINFLMDLFLWVARNDVKRLDEKNVRLRFLGSRDKLSDKLVKAIEAAEEKTVNNTAGTFALCLNYGGHQEIVDATKKLMAEGVAADDVTEELLASHLYAPDIPPIDLIIRTSGEQRLSNFMLWRAAYSELIFVDKRWPEFSEADLDSCLAEYASRQRRFGK